MKKFLFAALLLFVGLNIFSQSLYIDNRSMQSPIKNQGDRNTCSGFAVAACLEAFAGLPADISEQHIYAGLKMLEYKSKDPVDKGGRINLYPQTLSKYGILDEKRMPYNPSQLEFSMNDSNLVQIFRESQTGPVSMLVNIKYAKAFVAAEDCEVAEFDKGLEASNIIRLLNQGVKAIGIGYYVNGFWFDWDHKKNLVITPDSVGGFVDSNHTVKRFVDLKSMYGNKVFEHINDYFDPTNEKTWYFSSSQDAAGHAITIVGYNKDGFIIKNSWGKDWGDKGYATVSYDYHRLFAKRMLAIKKVSFIKQANSQLNAFNDLRVKLVPQGNKNGLSVSIFCNDEGSNPIISMVEYQLYQINNGQKKLLDKKLVLADILQKEYNNSFEAILYKGKYEPLLPLTNNTSLQLEVIYTGQQKIKRIYKNIQWINSDYKGTFSLN